MQRRATCGPLAACGPLPLFVWPFALPLLLTIKRFLLIFTSNVLENVNVLICKKKQDSVDVKTFSFYRFLVEKAGLCGGEDPALSPVRPPVNITFLERPRSRLACFAAMLSLLFNIMKVKVNYIKLKWSGRTYWQEAGSFGNMFLLNYTMI